MNSDPFIIAELSASHNGSINNALALIDYAKEAGADAVKIQTFEPDQIAAIDYTIPSGPWAGSLLKDLYREAHTPKSWHQDLFDKARDVGIELFSTPFHPQDVDFLEKLGCPRYKISSFDVINYPLIEAVSQTGKPVIMSTGMATIDEIVNAVITHDREMTLLHCVSKYPTDYNDVNLAKIDHLRTLAKTVGISDHSPGYLVPVMATAMGAQVIEKHICIDKSGLDGGFSMVPTEFRDMVYRVRLAKKIIGEVKYGPENDDSYKLRPSMFYSQDIKSGTILKPEHILIGRPSTGGNPENYYNIIGKELKHDVKKGDPCLN